MLHLLLFLRLHLSNFSPLTICPFTCLVLLPEAFSRTETGIWPLLLSIPFKLLCWQGKISLLSPLRLMSLCGRQRRVVSPKESREVVLFLCSEWCCMQPPLNQMRFWNHDNKFSFFFFHGSFCFVIKWQASDIAAWFLTAFINVFLTCF